MAKPPANAVSWWPNSIPAFVKHECERAAASDKNNALS
jgi:hypothetical protein